MEIITCLIWYYLDIKETSIKLFEYAPVVSLGGRST